MDLNAILDNLGKGILKIIQSPEFWAVWMLIVSLIAIIALKEFIGLIAKWLFIILLVGLLLYGVGVITHKPIQYIEKIINPIINNDKKEDVGFFGRIRGYGDKKAIAPVRWFRNSILRKDKDIDVVNHGWKNKKKS